MQNHWEIEKKFFLNNSCLTVIIPIWTCSNIRIICINYIPTLSILQIFLTILIFCQGSCQGDSGGPLVKFNTEYQFQWHLFASMIPKSYTVRSSLFVFVKRSSFLWTFDIWEGLSLNLDKRSGQYFQIGSVIGGIATNCGDREFPGIYSRIDHPDILNFISTNAFQKPLGNIYLHWKLIHVNTG